MTTLAPPCADDDEDFAYPQDTAFYDETDDVAQELNFDYQEDIHRRKFDVEDDIDEWLEEGFLDVATAAERELQFIVDFLTTHCSDEELEMVIEAAQNRQKKRGRRD